MYSSVVDWSLRVSGEGGYGICMHTCTEKAPLASIS